MISEYTLRSGRWVPRIHRFGLYRPRCSIEPTFQDHQSSGWQGELGQLTDLAHLERLRVGLASATWLTLWGGATQAREILSHPASDHRHTRAGLGQPSRFQSGLLDWQAPNWRTQLSNQDTPAFIFA